jgi:FeS assembly SUF system protein
MLKQVQHDLRKTMQKISKQELEEKIIQTLKTCYDPEIPVDIFELGLIYEIAIDDEANVKIKMTLTSPMCPVAGSLPPEVEKKVSTVQNVKSAKIDLVWNPPWDKDMMSEVAKLELGFL